MWKHIKPLKLLHILAFLALRSGFIAFIAFQKGSMTVERGKEKIRRQFFLTQETGLLDASWKVTFQMEGTYSKKSESRDHEPF